MKKPTPEFAAPSNEKRQKKDDLSIEHLSWLIESRMRNQTACLHLYQLFETYPVFVKNMEFRVHSQSLVSVGFSLWRAAFLADKTGQREEVFADAKSFLTRILTDNAINYPQDRSSREWTFNYYVTNATNGLLKLAEKWPDINVALSKYERVPKRSRTTHRRWNCHQNAFEKSIECLSASLELASQKVTTVKKRRATRDSAGS